MKKHQSNKKRIVIGCIAVVFVVLLCLSAFAAKDILTGSLSDDRQKMIVAQGDGTIAIAEKLKKEEVVSSPKLFEAYAVLKGYDGQWQSGTFVMTKGMGYDEICSMLTKPTMASVKVVIPEGKQIRQMAKLYEAAGICSSADFLDAAANHHFDYPFLEGISHENPLEGYLFPDTYYFEKNTDPDEIINEMLTNFQQKAYQDQYLERCKELGYSFDDMVILASIVESEANTEADRKTVAGVFMNRLTNPAYTKLQSCVTVEYALGIKKSIISYADTQVDSPYNTYMYPGLPIGPICCPGIEALEAALYPEENDYYYFQSDKNGKLYFAATYQEHAAIQEQVQAAWKGEVIEDYNE